MANDNPIDRDAADNSADPGIIIFTPRHAGSTYGLPPWSRGLHTTG